MQHNKNMLVINLFFACAKIFSVSFLGLFFTMCLFDSINSVFMFVWEKWSSHLMVQGFWCVCVCACSFAVHINYMLLNALCACIYIRTARNQTKLNHLTLYFAPCAFFLSSSSLYRVPYIKISFHFDPISVFCKLSSLFIYFHSNYDFIYYYD